ncbi:Uncharacterized protein involved in exopolysaccharide biosynthesis [Sphingomonas palmae]|uniref:Uncharacterized protein involved in exopolysaccharide biosynthesis n=1 Tax=Sphingomonas palmae TaxID=1855283 RepID=A0A1H7U353_9SPHN|nr:hypothetical protein [Sphingomonas palmae]SEL91244.1 Uncharacterized protein involved in exopolysaccharide biosynthesis [Sphingomonas palmae]
MNGIGATYLRIVLSRWRLILALVLSCTLVAGGVSQFILTQKPKFEAAARLNIVPTAEELGYASRFVRGSTFDGGSVLLGTYAEFARTRPVVAPIVDRYIAEHAAAAGQTSAQWIAANTGAPSFSPGRILSILNYGEAPPLPLREDMIEAVLEGTTIETVEGTYLIRIAVEWDDPQSAAWFANALADAIIARADNASRNSGRELAGTIENRLDQKRAELAAVLKRSRDLKSSIGVVDIDRQKQSLLEARLTEQAALTTDRAARDSAASQVAALRRQAGGKLSSAQGVLDQTLAVEAPRASGLERSVAIREGRIAQLDRQIAGLGGYEDRVKALDDQATALQAEVTALTERVSFSQTENLANGPRIQLIERATPPLVRSSPKVFFNTILGFIAGCALAACALLLLGPAPERRQDDDVQEEEAHAPDAPLDPVADEDLRPVAAVHPIRPEPAPVTMPAPARPISFGNVAVATPPGPAVRVDHHLARPLPRPAAQQGYSPAEIAAAGQLLSEDATLRLDDDRPVFVGAVGQDRDAQHLSQLVHGLLRRGERRLHIVDGTQPGANWDGPNKPFVYLGGLQDSARPDVIARVPDDAVLLLAASGDERVYWREQGDTAALPTAHVVDFDS